MENDRHGELEHLRGPIDDPAHELDTRRADALAAIDRAPFSWFHVKVCLVAGSGFFTDAYDIFAINLASVMLGYVYGHTGTTRTAPTLESQTQPYCPSPRPSPGQLSPGQEFGIKVAAPIGNLFGQLLFGWLADILGRKRMYGIELMIIITATLVQALVGSGQAVNIIGVIAFWRFVMGVGVGGDYPLSAVITSEFAPTPLRGRLMTAVFTAQGWGNFAASLVALIVIAAYKDSIISGGACRVDYCWRILIGLGCVPGVIALYFRLTIPETPRFTMDIDRDVQRAATDIDNQQHIGHVQDIAQQSRRVSLVVSLAGLLPGYYATFFLIDVWGRKPIQFMGFSALTVLLAVIGTGSGCLSEMFWTAGIYPGSDPDPDQGSKTKAFVALYCLANFFANFGPNVTTFIIPGEIFPTRYRSTAHGIAAASGKLGAIVSQIIIFKVGGSDTILDTKLSVDNKLRVV
ncbi:major facilitator superfamily domain-containing protein [Lactarius akahatsu]|uniref:Major facilitator superfamily domain-containing protein n=1 Tax=Lactarius akahatsu TaxID=416441 RepID=A0AAD4L5D3_9AGAM|nr:major facilitator superfamily domain-containing protein [Lactarius akahatsu]